MCNADVAFRSQTLPCLHQSPSSVHDAPHDALPTTDHGVNARMISAVSEGGYPEPNPSVSHRHRSGAGA